LAYDGPVLLDVLTNPEEIAVPPGTTLPQAWGFAIAKLREHIVSADHRDECSDGQPSPDIGARDRGLQRG
jgi:hypothetical protein